MDNTIKRELLVTVRMPRAFYWKTKVAQLKRLLVATSAAMFLFGFCIGFFLGTF